MKSFDSTIRELRIEGINLEGATLGEETGKEARLLVFLRHFGCVFCRELIEDLRDICATREDFPRPLFFTLSGVERSREFFAGRWAEAAVVADPKKVIYEAVGSRKGKIVQLFGPKVWAASRRAAKKGHRVGKPEGDPRQMPGMFLVQGTTLLWEHDFEHAGDLPDLNRVTDHLRLAPLR
jgi:AhpC/TSA antioxidant enzyme